ncbi:lactonase family protein [Zafaria sp. Z1313]|uniref:lactonase family protein n=1 Tax=unclassified Zafaria TaxID=2828765 RepID=UPI002E765CF2|nr:beta-propeller fold lactonase family protein [Zafaria sp. J156]
MTPSENPASPADGAITVLLGCNAGRSVDVLSIDPATGSVEAAGRLATDAPVQCLALGRNGRVHVALGSTPPSVATFALAGAGFEPLGGTATEVKLAHLAETPDGRALIGASYDRHRVLALGIDDDGAAAPARGPSPSPGRHAHAALASPDGRFVYATGLGDDAVAWWPWTAEGTLGEPADGVATGAGSGPRHLRFSPDGRHLFVLTEMSGEVIAYRRDAETGGLEEVARTSAVPADRGLVPGRVRNGTGPDPDPNAIWCAELCVDPEGRFLYASERTTSTVNVLRWDGSAGVLEYVAAVETERQPRGMGLDPSGRFLVACGEASDTAAVYRVARDTGLPERIWSGAVSAGPRWVEFPGA